MIHYYVAKILSTYKKASRTRGTVFIKIGNFTESLRLETKSVIN